MEFSYWKILFTVICTMFGWFVVHWLNSKRDHENKKREMRIKYSINAYRKLEDTCHRYEDDLTGRLPKLESALADIQLFGTDEQIEMAQTAIDTIANEKEANVEPLLQNLRANLRQELALPITDKTITYLRYGRKA